MAKRKTVIPMAAVERLIRNAAKKYGIVRVSGKAVAKTVDTLETLVKRLAEEASRLAAHAGRVTVTKEDIDMAKGSIRTL